MYLNVENISDWTQHLTIVLFSNLLMSPAPSAGSISASVVKS